MHSLRDKLKLLCCAKHLMNKPLHDAWMDVTQPVPFRLPDSGWLACVCRAAAAGANGKGGRISVNYDGFIDDVSVGDELLVDGGIMSFVVKGKTDTDVTVSRVQLLLATTAFVC